MTPFLVAFLIAGLSATGGRERNDSFMACRPTDQASGPCTSREDSAIGSFAFSEPDTVRAGRVFITNLPDSLNGLPVVHYRGVSLPALSYLTGRAFFWRTSDGDRGEHEFWFRTVLQDERVDSVSVRVSVE